MSRELAFALNAFAGSALACAASCLFVWLRRSSRRIDKATIEIDAARLRIESITRALRED